jgi:hypothetical protein
MANAAPNADNGQYFEEDYVEPDYVTANESRVLQPPPGQVFLIDEDGHYLTDTDGAFLTEFIDNDTAGQATTNRDMNATTLASEWTGITADRQLLVTAKNLVPPVMLALEAMIAQLEFGHNGGPRIAGDDGKLEALRKLHNGLGRILEVADRGELGSDLGFGLISEVKGYAKRAGEMVKDDGVKWGLTAVIAAVCASLGDFSVWGGVAVGAVQSVPRPKQKHD